MQYDTEEVTRPQVETFVNEVNSIITNDLINLPTVSALLAAAGDCGGSRIVVK